MLPPRRGVVPSGLLPRTANQLAVRGSNPDGTNPPRVGIIQHTYTPTETLISFMWVSLRDGLLSVIKK